MKDVVITFDGDGNVFKKIVKQSIIPSEMEIVKIPRNLLENNYKHITVSIVPKE